MGKGVGRISPRLKKINQNSKFARALEDPNDPIIGVYKQSVIAAELRRHKGAVSSTAKALDITKATLEKYIMKSKVLKSIVCEIVETEIDEVESELMTQVRKGNMTAILFYLKCKGKDRGWVEKNELTVDVKPITFKYNLAKGGVHAAKRAAKEK
jgi:predicted transcriptional regulator